MPKMTPEYTHNVIRRALRAVVDPEPTDPEKDELWRHFGSRCAYCGRALVRGDREGHVDHLVSASAGGPNHFSNRVLACRDCDNEKSDASWMPFLKAKAGTGARFAQRKKRIDAWIARYSAAAPEGIDADLVEREAERVIASFDRAVERVGRSGRG